MQNCIKRRILFNINTRLFLFWSMNQECHVDEEKNCSRMQSQAKWCGTDGSVPTSSLPFTLKEVYATLHLSTFILTVHQWNMLKVLANATRSSSLEPDHHLELVTRLVEGLRRVRGTHIEDCLHLQWLHSVILNGLGSDPELYPL